VRNTDNDPSTASYGGLDVCILYEFYSDVVANVSYIMCNCTFALSINAAWHFVEDYLYYWQMYIYFLFDLMLLTSSTGAITQYTV